MQTVGYGWAEKGGGGWKRGALGDNKEGLCNRKAFGKKGRLLRIEGRACSNGKLLVFRIGWRLRTEKKGLRKKDDVWRAEISGFRMHLERFSANGNIFVLRKRRLFQLMKSHPIKKSLLPAQQNFNFSPHPN